MRSSPFAVVTGGGTGGHVSPALAVAEALVDRGHAPGEILFVGGRRGVEKTLVPEAGFELVSLPGRGIRRSASLKNLSSLFGLGAATVMALAMALFHRPRVVVTVGGYAGLPYALAAVACRIPLVVVNLDAVPGAANRLVARFADGVAVALPGTGLREATVTGAPLRRVVLAAEKDDAARKKVAARLGVEAEADLVVVTGGSLGARSLNEAALEMAEALKERGDIAIYHVAGDRNLDATRQAAEAAGLFSLPPGALGYRLVGFDADLVSVLAASALAICRAGASTVAELTAIGLASILVPLPGAPRDHQSHNARVLEENGAAIALRESELNGERLAALVAELCSDRARRGEMALAAATLGRRDGAEKVADIAEEAVRKATTRARREKR